MADQPHWAHLHLDLEQIHRLYDDFGFVSDLLRGRASSGMEVQRRQQEAMRNLNMSIFVDRLSNFNLRNALGARPGDIITYEPIPAADLYVDPDRIFARKKIGGKLYRKEVAWINEHGFVVIHELKKSEKCMAVVKNDSIKPDWNWQAMQSGENWAKRGTPWQSRIPR